MKFINVDDETYDLLKALSHRQQKSIPEVVSDIIIGFTISTCMLKNVLESEENDAKE